MPPPLLWLTFFPAAASRALQVLVWDVSAMVSANGNNNGGGGTMATTSAAVAAGLQPLVLGVPGDARVSGVRGGVAAEPGCLV